MKHCARFFLLALAALLCGCHTDSEDANVKIETAPAGAVVKISGVEIGKTPLSIRLSTFFETQITLEKNGFKTEMVTARPVNRTIRPNPIKVELVPALVPDDPAKLKPDVCKETLEWMRASGQFEAADLEYIGRYLQKLQK